MNTLQTLKLPFLGARDYLQGSTLFDALASRLGRASDISFRLSRLIRTDRVAIESIEPSGKDADRYCATMTWSENGQRRWLGVVPDSPSELPERVSFDEQLIVRRARFSGPETYLADQGSETLVRTVVALNKALLQRLLLPPQPGQWLFVRLDLERYTERFGVLRLTKRTNVGFAAVSSLIEADGASLGTVMFSWLKK